MNNTERSDMLITTSSLRVKLSYLVCYGPLMSVNGDQLKKVQLQ